MIDKTPNFFHQMFCDISLCKEIRKNHIFLKSKLQFVYHLGFKLNNSTQPYIFLLQDDSTQVDLGILAAFPVHDTGRRQFIGNPPF